MMRSGAAAVSKGFDKMSNIVGVLGVSTGALLGAFSFKNAIAGTMELLEGVQQVHKTTGMAHERAGGLIDLMTAYGFETKEATRSLMMMSRAGERMEYTIGAMTTSTNLMYDRYEELGVDLKAGPEKAFMRMADLAQNHKLSVNDLQLMYRVTGEKAVKMISMLEKGPKYVKEQIDAFDKLDIATKENVLRQERIRVLQYSIASTWGDIAAKISVKFLPVIEDVLQRIQDNLNIWLQKADVFGERLAGWLKEHLGLVKAVGKAMMFNFMLMRLTGAGIGGNLTRGYRGLQRVGSGMQRAGAVGTGAAARMGRQAARTTGIMEEMARGAGFMGMSRGLTNLTGKLAGLVGIGGATATAAGGGGAGAGTAAAAGAAKGAGAVVAGVGAGTVAAAAAAILVVVGAVVAGVIAIKDNFEGVRTKMLDLWDRIRGHFKSISVSVAPVTDFFKTQFSRDGAFGRFFMLLLPKGIIAVLNYTEKFLQVTRTIGVFVGKLASGAAWIAEQTAGAWQWLIGRIVGWFETEVAIPIKGHWTDLKNSFYAQVYNPISQWWHGLFKSFDTSIGTPLMGYWEKIAGVARDYLFGPLGKAFKTVQGWIGKVFGPFMEGWRSTDFDLGWLQPAVNTWRDSWNEVKRSTDNAVAAIRAEEQARKATAKQAERARPDQKPPANNFDFRGSKFDIKQMFAEGFDPDRVAVAFANDLATLGEKKVQSGMAPLFSVR